MMAPLGRIESPATTNDVLARARIRASYVPDLLVEARRVVNTVIAGWHGRRRQGIGENFWQFRPYVEGEPVARIDWRRSARDEHVYLRDREWEASHTVWLWADLSPSMLYRSSTVKISKESRALVLAFALAELLSRSGERIGWPGLSDPFFARNGAERLAALIAHATEHPRHPNLTAVKNYCDVILISDFLDPVERSQEWLVPLADRGVRAHLIEIADPAEETFPYAGRTRFTDPESAANLTAGRAESYADEYRALYLARREVLSQWCQRLGWGFCVNRTDRLASEALVKVHQQLSEEAGAAFRAGAPV